MLRKLIGFASDKQVERYMYFIDHCKPEIFLSTLEKLVIYFKELDLEKAKKVLVYWANRYK